MQANNWMPYPENKPTQNAAYLVTRQIMKSHKIINIMMWSDNLYEVDVFDFNMEEDSHEGWYDCDSEWGYYEVDNVLAFMPLPEVYGG